jgi:hypothetical protein
MPRPPRAVVIVETRSRTAIVAIAWTWATTAEVIDGACAKGEVKLFLT